VADDAAAQEQSGSNRAPLLVIFLFVVIVILITVIVSMYISYSLTTMVANRPMQEQYVFEEEQKTEAYIPFEGETKGSGIMAYIRTGAEQTSLTVKIDLSVGVSRLSLQPILQVNIAPLQDRVLAYFSDKTKEDVIYLFQRKVLGEELKEILNAILEKDLQVPKTSGRITSVHVTTLTFQSL
jgi:flagellar basal body-associated protein FliL